MFLCIYVFFKIQFIWVPVLKILFTALTPFLIAAFITYLLHPIIEKLHESGVPRPLAILIIYLFFFGGVGYSVYKGIPLFIEQLKDLNENLPQFTQTYRSWVTEVHDRTSTWPNGVHERIEQGINDLEATLEVWLAKVMTSAKGILNYIILLITVPFIVFYMLKDFRLIKKLAAFLTPSKWHEPGKHFLHDVDESLGNYIRGQLFVCLIIGSAATVALWIFKVPYPLLLGIIIGLTNVIPYFGPIIGAVPAAVIAATISMKLVVIVMIIIFALQFLEGNVLSPLIVGKTLHIHPLFIMLSLLIGGEVGGVIGLILAVPILAVIKVIILHLRVRWTEH
ncbi:AI-2E family transporter [Bacillus songklensis]|uniref:AI-2E family transporter n=1 Tax=Bacillus songklensis TaxID=1069116 RepID=A0ABV8B1J4_9BACI